MNLLLPSEVDIQDDFVVKVKRMFNVEIKYCEEALEPVDNSKNEIWFTLIGNKDEVMKANKYISAAKGKSASTTLNVFDSPSNHQLTPETIETIETKSCAFLSPNVDFIVVVATNCEDVGIAFSLLEQEFVLQATKSAITDFAFDISDDEIGLNKQPQIDDNFCEIEGDNLNNISYSKQFKSISNKDTDDDTDDDDTDDDIVIINPSDAVAQLSPHSAGTKSKSNDASAKNLNLSLNHMRIAQIAIDNDAHLFGTDANNCEFNAVEPEPFELIDLVSPVKASGGYYAPRTSESLFIDQVMNSDESKGGSDRLKKGQVRGGACGTKGNPKRQNDIFVTDSDGVSESDSVVLLEDTRSKKIILSDYVEDISTTQNTVPVNNLPVNKMLRYVVVDGSNVAMEHGKHNKFSCQGIKIVVDYFLRLGHNRITVIVPQCRRRTSDSSTLNPHILEELYQRGLLEFTPSRIIANKVISSYDDRYILKLASMEDGIIVTNDNFRDLYNEQPDWMRIIKQRILPYSFHKDHFMPPDDPLGKNGPSLAEFLRHSYTNKNNGLQLNNQVNYSKKSKKRNRSKFQKKTGALSNPLFYQSRDDPYVTNQDLFATHNPHQGYNARQNFNNYGNNGNNMALTNYSGVPQQARDCGRPRNVPAFMDWSAYSKSWHTPPTFSFSSNKARTEPTNSTLQPKHAAHPLNNKNGIVKSADKTKNEQCAPKINVKTEPGIKTEPGVAMEQEVKKEPGVKTEPQIKLEPGVYWEGNHKVSPRPNSVTKSIRTELMNIFPDRAGDIDKLLGRHQHLGQLDYFVSKMLEPDL